MRTQDEAIEDLQFLTQSPLRVQLLELLREEGELTEPELRARFDVARVTVQRNVEALVERDWIDNSRSTYTITPLGKLLIEELAPVTESIQLERRLRPFLRWVPRESFDLDPRALADATVIPVDPADPYNWVHYHVDRLESVSRTRMTLPMIGGEAWGVTTRRLLAGDLEAELIAEPAVADKLRTNPRYSEHVERILPLEGFELFVFDDKFPYGVGLFDRTVQLIVADDAGMPQALVETDATEAYEWAERTFEGYRARSTPFEF